MRICYVLLSPTLGMHQYTAGLANRMAEAGHDVQVVTTRGLPADRYGPRARIHTPISNSGTGFSPEGLNLIGLRRVLSTIIRLQPQVVHFTGVHLWNVKMVRALHRRSVPVVHTLHDLDPHHGRRFGSLIRIWNAALLRSGCHIMVHGRYYQQRLLSQGIGSEQITYSPLLHLCFSAQKEQTLRHQMTENGNVTWNNDRQPLAINYEPMVLFFGRLKPYKGVAQLLSAWTTLNSGSDGHWRLVLAGRGSLEALWPDPLPAGVEVRNHWIDDEEAFDLLCRCGLVVLPYTAATQSALVAASQFFCKPVVVARSGALSEYVQHEQTGWIVEPGDSESLASCLSEALSDVQSLALMGRAGRVWYDEQYRIEVDTLHTMYAKVGEGFRR